MITTKFLKLSYLLIAKPIYKLLIFAALLAIYESPTFLLFLVGNKLNFSGDGPFLVMDLFLFLFSVIVFPAIFWFLITGLASKIYGYIKNSYNSVYGKDKLPYRNGIS